ncbi:hypothetical protein DV517_32130 [Streptomyces sp. S816]|nr:hypothetical protein DV517_32130 [Streptomyces sp. S816]
MVAVDPATKSHENAYMTAFTAAGRGVPVETMLGASSEDGTNDQLDGATDSNGQEQQVSLRREAEHAALSGVQRRHAWMLGPRPGEPSLNLQGQGAARDLDILECQAIKSF